MSGHRPFRELTRAMSPARKSRVAQKVAAFEAVMALPEMRKARAVSQKSLAEMLEVGQPAVAKLEQRPDMYVSNLRRYVRALGGELEITARFPEGTVEIDLGDEAEPASAPARAR
jgi:hypothetical protein